MKNIIVAGSGPVGLYTAIRLKRLYGDQVNVIVADSHIQDYERPGIIAKMAVEFINDSFKKKGIYPIVVPDSKGYPTNSVYISDLQKSLLQQAERYGVVFEQKNFSKVEDHDVVVTKGHNSTKIHCDLLIDCTGERRAIAKTKSDNFQIETIAENPIKSHFIAYVHMNEENSDKFRLLDMKMMNPVQFALNMEHIRKNYGWKEFALPEIVTSKWELENNNTRYCIYTEIPPSQFQDKTQEEQNECLHALLKLRSGADLEYTIEKGDFKFTPFAVDPKVVSDPVSNTAYPFPVALCGDALMSAEYRFGTGVRNGINCASALVDAVVVSGKQIVINEKQFHHFADGFVNDHKKDVTDKYQRKNNSLLGRELNEAYEKYSEAYSMAKEKDDVEAQEIIANGLTDMAGKYKLAADTKLREALSIRVNAPYQFKEKLVEAEKLYQQSITMFETYCPKERAAEKFDMATRSHINLARICGHLERFDEAKEQASTALDISTTHNIVEMTPKVQAFFPEWMEKKCKFECSKLHKVNDVELIKFKQEALAHNLVQWSQSEVSPEQEEQCLNKALSHYKSADSNDYLQKRVEVYQLLIQKEARLSDDSTEKTVLYKQEISKIKTVLSKHELEEGRAKVEVTSEKKEDDPQTFTL